MDTVVADMSAAQVTIVAFGCGIGALLVGAVGIGGVVMTPSLLLAGVDAHLAIVSLFVAFTPTVYVRVYLLNKYTKCVPWMVGACCGAGAMFGSIMSGLFLLENAPRGVLTYLIGVISTLAGLRDLKGLYVLRRNKKRILRANALEDATGGGGFDTDNTTTAVVDMEKKNNVVTATAVGETETGAVKEDCKDEEKCDKEKENKECKGEEEEIIAVDKDQFENMTVLERWSEPTKSDFAIVFVMGVLTGITSVLTGTGGPITFLPMVILWKGHEVHRKVLIALSSVMSACLGTGAIISTLAAGIEAPDGGLCLIITSFAMLGVVVGVRLLEYVRKETLQLLMGLLLLAVGGFVLHQAVTKY